MYWSAASDASAAACATSIATSQAGAIFSIWRQEPSTSMTLGATRYSETPVMASQMIVRYSWRFGRFRASASPRAISLSTSAWPSIARSRRSPSAARSVILTQR